MELAQCKVIESKTKLWRYKGIRVLFMGKCDVKPNRFAAGIKSTTIGSLHDSWSPACCDHMGATTRSLLAG